MQQIHTLDTYFKAMPKPSQVITFNVDGTISGLVHKKGQGVDLISLGVADVKRASLIEWDELHQKWYIHLMIQPANRTIESKIVSVAELQTMIPQLPLTTGVLMSDETAYFDDYDLAVKAEVYLLDAYRKMEVSN